MFRPPLPGRPGTLATSVRDAGGRTVGPMQTLTRDAQHGAMRSLYLVAMALFTVTVVIGILNGADAVEFTHDQLLTHLHSGTVGWITLGFVATAFWLINRGDRRLALTLAVLVPLYVAAFYSGNFGARAVTGSLLLAAIVWLIVWAWRAGLAELTVPRLAVVLGLTTFTYGAIIGVLLQIQFASGAQLLPTAGDQIGAHAATMIFSYLILVAMGLLEWRVKDTRGIPGLGLVQIVALFAAGAVLALGLLLLPGNQLMAPAGIAAVLQILAVVLFLVRVVPGAIRAGMRGGPARHFAASSLFVIVVVVMFVYLIALVTAAEGDINQVPRGVGLASDHAAFIGVVTNLLFGLLLTLTADRRTVWPWADGLVFWAMNAGLLVFMAGLISETVILKQIGAPVMGTAILVGLAVAAVRLWGSDMSATGASEAS